MLGREGLKVSLVFPGKEVPMVFLDHRVRLGLKATKGREDPKGAQAQQDHPGPQDEMGPGETPDLQDLKVGLQLNTSEQQ